jgi:hypothetical protein
MGPQNLFLSAAPKRQARSFYFGMQVVSGRQGGMGLFDRAATPNAVPNTTNKNPSMIFAFICFSMPQ